MSRYDAFINTHPRSTNARGRGRVYYSLLTTYYPTDYLHPRSTNARGRGRVYYSLLTTYYPTDYLHPRSTNARGRGRVYYSPLTTYSSLLTTYILGPPTQEVEGGWTTHHLLLTNQLTTYILGPPTQELEGGWVYYARWESGRGCLAGKSLSLGLQFATPPTAAKVVASAQLQAVPMRLPCDCHVIAI